ncbi:MAG: hypothetical protein GF401_19015 [Chitinivibrionales bacterium]|nr:hypothetical protein [Chitinivibrionales bacterium]
MLNRRRDTYPYNSALRSVLSLIMPVGLLLIIACSQPAPKHFMRDEYLDIRRIPHISSVDDGKKAEKGEISASFNYQYALQYPGVRSFKESSYVSDDFTTLSIRSISKSYLTRHTMNISAAISPLDFLTTGLLIDISTGDVSSSVPGQSILNKNIFEFGWFFRLSAGIGRFSIAIRPEIMLFTLNGESRVVADSLLLTGASIHEIGFTERTMLVGRFQIIEPLGIFLGAQQKRQPYSLRSIDMTKRDILFENCFSLYTGMSLVFLRYVYLNSYVAFPFKTDYTGYREPVQFGSGLMFRIQPGE